MTSPFPNSYWLEPDRILCGEYPRDFDDLEDHEGMTAILQAGARVFIDLTEENELKPYSAIAHETAQDMGIEPNELEFHRFPIRDVSIPGKATDIRKLLQTIRLARHQGRIVYLHCWGGRGRTGTIAGCILRDLFHMSGEDALITLAERWLDCAKSEYSESPETEEQRGFVRSFNPVDSLFCYRLRSAILGAAVGDALGVPVEFESRSKRAEDPVTDMREFGTHHQPAGTWSDDTSMTLATMCGLVREGSYSPTAVMKEFVSWKEEGDHTAHGSVFDIGNATREAIDRFRNGTDAVASGGTGEWSNGNGSLMRILPIALAYGNDPHLIEKVQEISSLTHAHERSKMCCVFFCLVVSELLHGTSLLQSCHFAWEIMAERWTPSYKEQQYVSRLNPDRLSTIDKSEISGSGHVIDTLEASLWMNLRHDNYRNAVLHAVNLGDDTDTTGCVAGALAGLIHGEDSIPDSWLSTLVKRDEVTDRAEQFAQFCLQQSQHKENTDIVSP